MVSNGNNYETLSFLMVQVNRMLKPEKWQATFDSDGKVYGFQKALKLICLGVCCLIISLFPLFVVCFFRGNCSYYVLIVISFGLLLSELYAFFYFLL